MSERLSICAAGRRRGLLPGAEEADPNIPMDGRIRAELELVGAFVERFMLSAADEAALGGLAGAAEVGGDGALQGAFVVALGRAQSRHAECRRRRLRWFAPAIPHHWLSPHTPTHMPRLMTIDLRKSNTRGGVLPAPWRRAV